MVVNYQNGIIYKIVCNDTNEVYYGSTTQRLSQRIAQHMSCLKRHQKGYVQSNYCSSYQILERGNFSYEWLEDCPCEKKEQLHAREAFYVKGCECVNKIVPGRSGKEYREDCREKIKERKTKWYDKNKERLVEKDAKYRAEHKEEIRQRGVKYRAEHKDKIKEKKSEKVTCDCGCTVCNTVLARHKRTQKHLKLMQEKEGEVIRQKRTDKIACECGCVIRRDSLSRHKKSQNHIKLMKEKESE